MCELTFVNLKDVTLNKLYLFTQMNINSEGVHKDGFGIYSSDIYKNEGCFSSIVNPALAINNLVKDNKPVMGHCRHATRIYNKPLVIDVNNAHPFETDKLILAHNGMLEFRDNKNYDEYKDITVDSQIFLLELDKVYTGKNIVKALQETMKKFYGVFCFLIYSKLEKRWFAVRGDKRVLHYTFILEDNKKIGYVVNTDLEDMRKACKLFCKTASIVTGKNYTKDTTDWILNEETVYELKDNDIFNIGILQEIERPAVQVIAKEVDKKVKQLANFLLDTRLSIIELDYLVKNVFNEALLELSEENLLHLLNSVNKIQNHSSNKKGELWWNICKEYGYDPIYVYQSNPNLQIPYFMNSKDTLQALLNETLKKVKVQ